MTKAVSAQGEMLFVEKTSGVWTKIEEMKASPDVGTSASRIDATTLESECKEYIADIPDQGDIQFTFNAMPVGSENSNLDLIMGLSRNASYRWKWVAPRLGIQVVWTGEWNYTISAGSVSSVKEFTLTIIPRSIPIESKIGDKFTVTYDVGGVSGATAPVDSTQYENGATVTTKPVTGTPTKTFVCWNTKADNSGNAYDANDTFNIYQNTTLHAIWGE